MLEYMGGEGLVKNLARLKPGRLANGTQAL